MVDRSADAVSARALAARCCGRAGGAACRRDRRGDAVAALQREIHAIFIALVKQSRGARLKAADDVLFSGEYWAGDTSVTLGLADAIGDLRSTLRARYGENVQMPVIAPPTGLLAGLLGRKSGAGTTVAPDGLSSLPDELISALETRAIWGR